jgi:hypothetical protein
LPYSELVDILLEPSDLLLEFGAVSANVLHIADLLMFLFHAPDPFLAVHDFFLVGLWSVAMGALSKVIRTSNFLMDSSTFGRRARALPRLESLVFKSCITRMGFVHCPAFVGGLGHRTHVAFLLNVSPHELVLEIVDLLLLFNRLFGFLEAIFCGLGGTMQVREHLALLLQNLRRLPNIGNADFVLVRELAELRSLEEELKEPLSKEKTKTTDG